MARLEPLTQKVSPGLSPGTCAPRPRVTLRSAPSAPGGHRAGRQGTAPAAAADRAAKALCGRSGGHAPQDLHPGGQEELPGLLQPAPVPGPELPVLCARLPEGIRRPGLPEPPGPSASRDPRPGSNTLRSQAWSSPRDPRSAQRISRHQLPGTRESDLSCPRDPGSQPSCWVWETSPSQPV